MDRLLPRSLMAPAVVTLLIWMLVPLGMTIYFSLINYNLLDPGNHPWVGIENYHFFVTDPDFWPAVRNTMLLIGSIIIITVGLGVLLALLVNDPFPGRAVVRVLLISPFFVMPAVNALLWKHMMMNPIYGVLANLWAAFGLTPVDWMPHNRVSLDANANGVAERGLVIQFQHSPFEHAAVSIPELAQCRPLLERARHSIEFFSTSQRAEASCHQFKSTKGMHRPAAFCGFLGDLAECGDYRLLSNVQINGAPAATEVDQVGAIINHVTAYPVEPISMAEVAPSVGMSESRFSRFFWRGTGNTFTEFVNRVRINNACHLLMQSDRLVADICFLVGFNNVAIRTRCANTAPRSHPGNN